VGCQRKKSDADSKKLSTKKVTLQLGALLLIATASPQSTTAGLFGATSFEDCVLENLRNPLPPRQVYVVKQMCRAKFPLKKNECIAKEASIRSDEACKLSLRKWDEWKLERKKDPKYFDLPPGLPPQCELPFGCEWKED
jgi:hypothetical protein